MASRGSLNAVQSLILSVFRHGRFNDLTRMSQVKAENDPALTAIVSIADRGGLRALAREANEAADALDLNRAIATMDTLRAFDRLWWFIENVPLDARWRSDAYFHLRSTTVTLAERPEAEARGAIQRLFDTMLSNVETMVVEDRPEDRVMMPVSAARNMVTELAMDIKRGDVLPYAIYFEEPRRG